MQHRSGRRRAAKWVSMLTGGMLALTLIVESGAIPVSFSAPTTPSGASLSISTTDLLGNPLGGSYIGNVVDVTTGQVIYLGSLNTPQTFQGLTVGQQYSVTVNDNSPLYVVAASVGTFVRTTTGGGGAGVTTFTLQANTGVVFSLSPTPPTTSTTTTSTTTSTTTTSTTTATTTTTPNPVIQLSMPCSYYIFIDKAGFYNAQSCGDGSIIYGGVANAGGASGTSFSQVLSSTWNALVVTGGGTISLGAGSFPITSSVNIPTVAFLSYHITGISRDLTHIKVVAPAQILGPSVQGASFWPRFYISDLSIEVSGTYGSNIVPQGAAVNFQSCWVELTNVLLSYSSDLQAIDGRVRTGFSFGGYGSPGEGIDWRNVYFSYAPSSSTGSQGGTFGLSLHNEGFTWSGGGIALNYGFTETTRTSVLSLTGGAGQGATLNNLALYMSPPSYNNKLFAYLITERAILTDTELPSAASEFVYDFFPCSSCAMLVTLINPNGNEGNSISPSSITYPGPSMSSYLDVIGYSRVTSSGTIAVGLSNSYGTTTKLDAYLTNAPQIKITPGGTFGAETVTVQVTAVSVLGTTASFTASFTGTGTYTLSPSDWASILSVGVMKELDISAKTTAASTSATITIAATV